MLKDAIPRVIGGWWIYNIGVTVAWQNVRPNICGTNLPFQPNIIPFFSNEMYPPYPHKQDASDNVYCNLQAIDFRPVRSADLWSQILRGKCGWSLISAQSKQSLARLCLFCA